jgi:CubicO group peptidase (beta-lactamase class C family)
MTSVTVERAGGAPRPPDGALAEIAGILADHASRSPVPGLAVSVFDDTTILVETALGIRAIDSPGDAMTENTLFRLISLTKMFTTLAAMRLADTGRLALDEPIGELFPAPGDLPAPLPSVTVRQLLSHTSGLARGELNLDVGSRDPGGLADYTLRTGIHTPFIADPGAVYSYSDYGFSIVGYLIERVTGHYFAEAVRELVFEPLGMRSACFEPTVAMTYPLSQQHVYRRPSGLVQYHRFAEATRIHPCVGAFCSAHELALFGMVHLSEGLAPGRGDRVLSAAAVREMHDPRTDIGLDIDLRYGLGAYAGPRYGGHLAYGHEGYTYGTWAKLILIPGTRVGLAWCDNSGPIPALNAARYRTIDEILTVLCGTEPSWHRPEGSGADDGGPGRQRYAGRYQRPAGRPVDVTVHDDALVITDGAVTVRLAHYRGSVFVAEQDAPVPPRAPWEPHAGSSRCCVRFAGPSAEAASYLTLNGLTYRRQPPRP